MASFGNFVFLFILKISLQCITLKILSFGRPFRCFIDWWLMIEVLHTMYHFRKENWNSVVRGLVLASFWHVPMQTGLWELLGCSRSVHTFVLLSVTTCISDDDDIHTKTMSKQRNNEKDFTGYLGSLEADQGERRRDRTSPHNSQHDLWGGVFSFIAIPSSPIQHQNFCNISAKHLYGVQFLNMCTTSKQFPFSSRGRGCLTTKFSCAQRWHSSAVSHFLMDQLHCSSQTCVIYRWRDWVERVHQECSTGPSEVCVWWG